MEKGQMALSVQLGLVTTAFLFSGCNNMPSIDALFDTSPEAIGTGITGVGLVRAVVIIAKYQATERQRQVAEQNARRAYQNIVARQETIERPSRPKTVIARKASEPPKKIAATSEPVALGAHEPKPGATPAPAPPAPTLPPVERPTKIPRYIAVDTAPDTRSKGTNSVMIWDTTSKEMVGNEVYDVEAPPPIMAKARFESYSAEYVGTGRFSGARKMLHKEK